MKRLDKATMVVSKLIEVARWIGAVSMVVGLILTLVMGEAAVIFGPEDYGVGVTAYSFDIMLVNAAGELNMAAVRLFCVSAAVLMGLMAMVWRNVYLILKNSRNATPFQKDNIRMVREIGIFLISGPVVSLVMSVVASLLLGPEVAEVSVRLESVFVGLAVLCLSRIFVRGMELEADVDGLV